MCQKHGKLGDLMSFNIDENVLSEIKSKADIVDVISDYVNLKKTGSNYMGLCPFHSEKSPSFSVSPSKEMFKCFGCGVGGDVITFIMKKENLDFPDAVKLLADKYNIELASKSSYDHKLKEKKERNYEANRKAARFYIKSLLNNKFALNYLLSRGINNKIIIKFGIGFADGNSESLLKYLLAEGYNHEELLEFNLISKRDVGSVYFDRFRNRIMFPILDYRSQIIGFGGRSLDESIPKYLNSSETPVFNKGRNLYGLNIISKESDREKILLVEGYMDVISLYKNGINYSTASLGTALTQDQARLMKRFGKDIYICYDGDEAGKKATDRSIDIMLLEDIKPKILTLPDSMDPDDFIKKHGPIIFESLLTKAKNHIDFKIEQVKQNFNINNASGLTGFILEVSKILSKIKSPVEQDIYIDIVSKEYNISKDALFKEINTSTSNKELNNKTNIKKTKPYNKKRILRSGEETAQDMLIKYSLIEKDCFYYIEKHTEKNFFKNNEALNLYNLIEDYFSKEDKREIMTFLKEKSEEGYIDNKYLNYINSLEVDLLNSKEIIRELIYKINTSSLEKERKEVLNKITEIDKKTFKDESDLTEIQSLITKLAEINKNLNTSFEKKGG